MRDAPANLRLEACAAQASSLSIVCPADNGNARRGLNSHGPFANGPYENNRPS